MYTNNYKLAFTLLTLTLCLNQAISANIPFGLTSDFLSGFETGILSRSNPKAMEDYTCPEPKFNND